MSSSTPSKERRAERHLMRVRGAGKIARDVSQNLFAFTIAARSQDSLCPKHGRVSPTKKRKLNPEDGQLQTSSTGPLPQKGQDLVVKAAAKARARQAGQKFLNEALATKTTKSKTTVEELPNVSTTGSTVQHEIKRSSKTKTVTTVKTSGGDVLESTSTTEATAVVSLPPTADRSACPPASIDEPGHDAPTSQLKRKRSANSAKDQDADEKLEVRGTTKSTRPDRKKTKPKAKAIVKAKAQTEPKAKTTSRNKAVPLSSKRTVSGTGDDDMESLPPSRSSMDLTKAVPPPRPALSSISPNRGNALPAKRPATHSEHDTKLTRDSEQDEPSKSKDKHKSSVMSTVLVSGTASRPQDTRVPARPATLPSVTCHNQPMLVSKTTSSTKTAHLDKSINDGHSQVTSRKRFAARFDDDDDVDLDDLITNISTLTRGIEHRSPQQLIPSSRKRRTAE